MILDNLFQPTAVVSESSFHTGSSVSPSTNIKQYQRTKDDVYDTHSVAESLAQGGSTLASSTCATTLPEDEDETGHRLYGRQSERLQLSEIYQRWSQSWWKTSQCCFVSGPTGVGKSALWQSLRLCSSPSNSGLVVLQVNVSPLEGGDIPSLAVGLLQHWSAQTARDEELQSLLHQQIVELVDPSLLNEVGLGSLQLLDAVEGVVPAERIDANHSSSSSNTEQSSSSHALSNAQLEALQSMVRSILQHLADHRLLVVVLEDLHWATRAQLDFLGAALPRRVFVVATLRDNTQDEGEDDDNPFEEAHPRADLTVETALEGVKQFCTAVDHWPLRPLPRECITDLVQDRFRGLRGEEAEILTQYLSDESHGNWHALEEHLKTLQDHGTLHNKPSSPSSPNHASANQWQLCRSLLPGASVITMEEACQNKIRSLPQQVQNVLTLAAVIGSRSINQAFLNLMVDDHDTLYPSIQRATDERLIVVDDSGTRFANHLVQRTLYSQIPEGKRAALHLQVGGRIWSEHRDDDDDELLMFVVRHLMLGEEALSSYQDQINVCRLYQRAGHVMMKSRDVSLAAICFRRAIVLLNVDGWQDHYGLSLDLHNCLAEACFCVSDKVELSRQYHVVGQHARCIRDTCWVTALQIHAWASRGLYDQAWELGTGLLSKLGEMCLVRCRAKTWRIQLVLRGRSNESIRRLPAMEDPRAKALMHVLASLAAVAFASKPKHLPALAIRMMELTLKFGLSQRSGIGFATYGMHLARSGKDIAEAERFGKLALNLCQCDSLGSILTTIPVMGYYGCVCPWMEPFSELYETLQDSFQKTLKVRDMNTAALYSVVNAWSQFESNHLPSAGKEFQSYVERIRSSGQTSSLPWHLPRWNLISTLVGFRIDLTSKEVAMLQKKPSQGPVQWSSNLCSLMSEYLLGDVTSAAQRLPLLSKECLASGMDTAAAALFESLTLLAQHRANPQRALTQIVQGHIKEMRKWAKRCPHLFSGKLALVQAELASAMGDDTEAVAKYQLAIAKSQETQWLLQEALANERAAFHFWDRNDVDQAKSLGDEAVRLYEHWGAFHKADLLRRELAGLNTNVHVAA